MTTLWHYTCDHGHKGIGDEGWLLPASAHIGHIAYFALPVWRQALCDLIWLTDMDQPIVDALGLTSHNLSCDRTAHRYRVTDYNPARYTAIRRDLPKRLRDELESAPGAMPAHWWVAYAPVPVVYDPIPAAEEAT